MFHLAKSLSSHPSSHRLLARSRASSGLGAPSGVLSPAMSQVIPLKHHGLAPSITAKAPFETFRYRTRDLSAFSRLDELSVCPITSEGEEGEHTRTQMHTHLLLKLTNQRAILRAFSIVTHAYLPLYDWLNDSPTHPPAHSLTHLPSALPGTRQQCSCSVGS